MTRQRASILRDWGPSYCWTTRGQPTRRKTLPPQHDKPTWLPPVSNHFPPHSSDQLMSTSFHTKENALKNRLPFTERMFSAEFPLVLNSCSLCACLEIMRLLCGGRQVRPPGRGREARVKRTPLEPHRPGRNVGESGRGTNLSPPPHGGGSWGGGGGPRSHTPPHQVTKQLQFSQWGFHPSRKILDPLLPSSGRGADPGSQETPRGPFQDRGDPESGGGVDPDWSKMISKPDISAGELCIFSGVGGTASEGLCLLPGSAFGLTRTSGQSTI